MIFRLWHKLVLTMISMMGVVLILALFISQKSVETGFLAYINQVENKRLDFITTRLVNEYRKENNWDFIRNNSELWRFYSRPQGLPRANIKPRSLPLLHELATKPGEEGDIQDLQRPPRPPRPKFDSDEPRGNILPDGPPPRPERTDRGDERRPPPK